MISTIHTDQDAVVIEAGRYLELLESGTKAKVQLEENNSFIRALLYQVALSEKAPISGGGNSWSGHLEIPGYSIKFSYLRTSKEIIDYTYIKTT